MQKIFYLPEAHTDFILAVIGEELGAGGDLRPAVPLRHDRVRRAADRQGSAKGVYAKLLAAGLTSLILCQALLNVYAVLGLAPLTGVPLPFISSRLDVADRAAVRDGAAAQRRAAAARAHLRAVRGRATSPSGARPPRIVIAAGGTAGHVVPALAVADALRAEGAEVVFVGRRARRGRARARRRLRARHARASRASARSNPLKAARAVAEAGAGARRRARHPRARAAPTPCSAAAATSPARSGSPRRCGGIPLVLTEADSHLGLTNRLLAPRARRVCLAFPIEGRDGDRYLRHRPPRAADRSPTAPRARAELGIAPEETCVLVFGGSLGARSINRGRGRGVRGRPVPRPPRRRRARLRRRSPRRARTTTCATTSTPFGNALAAADLAVARAGGSVFELAQYGLPAVLVPYPHASADHQTANARWMARGAAPRRSSRRRADAAAPARARSTRCVDDPERPAAMAARGRGARPARRRARHRRRGPGSSRSEKLGRARRRGAAPRDRASGSTDQWPDLAVGDDRVGRERALRRPQVAEHRAQDRLLDGVVAADHLADERGRVDRHVEARDELDEPAVVIRVRVGDDDAEQRLAERVGAPRAARGRPAPVSVASTATTPSAPSTR